MARNGAGMAFELYDFTVVPFLRTVSQVSWVLDKGLDHCREKGIDPQDMVDTRLIEDMRPLQFQVQSVAHHSVAAIESIQTGTFTPPPPIERQDYAGLQAMAAGAKDRLEAMKPDVINGLVGRDVVLKIGDRVMPFTAEDFLLTFSLPNFYFHATTTYDILRMKGVPLQKRDYLGPLKLKG